MALENTSQNNAAAAGQFGSALLAGANSMTAPAGKYFFSITFLADTEFTSSVGLVSTDDTKYINTQSGSSGGAQVTASHTFPAGTTIFGQWTGIRLADAGSLIVAQLGN